MLKDGPVVPLGKPTPGQARSGVAVKPPMRPLRPASGRRGAGARRSRQSPGTGGVAPKQANVSFIILRTRPARRDGGASPARKGAANANPIRMYKVSHRVAFDDITKGYPAPTIG